MWFVLYGVVCSPSQQWAGCVALSKKSTYHRAHRAVANCAKLTEQRARRAVCEPDGEACTRAQMT